MIYTITVAFCPASQLARCLYRFNSLIKNPHKPTIVMGHYPINTKKNNRDIQLIAKDMLLEVKDPGYDMGSAQSQWWCLEQINFDRCMAGIGGGSGLGEKDFWINLDPDSYCGDASWIGHAQKILENDPNCVVVSCMSPMVESFLKTRNIKLERKDLGNQGLIYYDVAHQPVPFNLSMWRYSFFKEIGGIPQRGEKWGEVEGPVFHYAQQMGKYHAYLPNHYEDESGKFMQDRTLLEYKDRYLRTSGPEQFIGSYTEFLEAFYPELLKIDTFIPEDTIFQ